MKTLFDLWVRWGENSPRRVDFIEAMKKVASERRFTFRSAADTPVVPDLPDKYPVWVEYSVPEGEAGYTSAGVFFDRQVTSTTAAVIIGKEEDSFAGLLAYVVLIPNETYPLYLNPVMAAIAGKQDTVDMASRIIACARHLIHY